MTEPETTYALTSRGNPYLYYLALPVGSIVALNLNNPLKYAPKYSPYINALRLYACYYKAL